ncbi:MAG: cyoB [Candidatus Kaiserbacteria bacterium]|nr:cyoB [Candidatus Kaiserbacteria bacterium]
MNLFGNLTLSAFPHDPIIFGATILMSIVVIAVLSILTVKHRWTWLWKNWITTVDHKRIGIMYLILAFVMMVRGFIDAAMMRGQLAVSAGSAHGFLPPDHYDQVFTAHGVIMIFFVAMPLMFGLINLATPLLIGSRDVAFPFVNSLSLWLAVSGALLLNLSLSIGEFARTGWLAYPPLSELVYSPGVGVDYYIWCIQIAGVGSLLSGINFLVTILRMRAPGMTLMRMPVFVWTTLSAMSLVVIVFPILTVTLALLFLDRFYGMHFFSADFGGNPMMYINLIWSWGHPEVYILILPAFGIFSEVVPVFSRKQLFGYTTMIWATVAITFFSFIVWVHHFFTMGADANVNAFFGIATMIIAIPTGVKIFNWLFTMYRGRITFTTPMLWTMGFISTFTFGGMTGVLMAIPAADFQLHNSLFLIAHFHNTIIGGVIFGYFAGLAYWFPKFFGFKLNEKYGTYAFWCWVIGFFVAFLPIYIVGLMGMTRRLSHYDITTGWQPFLIIAAIGVCIIALGGVFQGIQLYVSFRDRKHNKDLTGDPWDGRTLEWSTSSPPPFYNFAHIPTVHGRHAFWDMKYGEAHMRPQHSSYEDIVMPKNTPLGFIIAAFALVFGFAIVWHITWLCAVALIGIIASVMVRSFDQETEYVVSAETVALIESRRHKTI